MAEPGEQWHVRREWTPLPPGAVGVWASSLDPWRPHFSFCSALLSSAERERATRFRQEAQRLCYGVGRAVLRLLLARETGCAPESLDLIYNAHGKPELSAGSAGEPLHFNVSHAGGYVAWAITRAAPVGVDIEVVNESMPRQEEIAQRYFAPGESAQFAGAAAGARGALFFRCWTRKEAFLKARGEGIFGGLDTFEVSLDAGPARLLHIGGDTSAGASWSLAETPPLPGLCGADAVAAPGCAFTFQLVTPELLVAAKNPATNV